MMQAGGKKVPYRTLTPKEKGALFRQIGERGAQPFEVGGKHRILLNVTDRGGILIDVGQEDPHSLTAARIISCDTPELELKARLLIEQMPAKDHTVLLDFKQPVYSAALAFNETGEVDLDEMVGLGSEIEREFGRLINLHAMNALVLIRNPPDGISLTKEAWHEIWKIALKASVLIQESSLPALLPDAYLGLYLIDLEEQVRRHMGI